LTAIVVNDVDKVEWSSSTLTRCGVCFEIHTRTSMKDAKKKQPPAFQIEEVMIIRMNVVNGRKEIGTARRQRRREEASKQFGRQARSRSKSRFDRKWTTTAVFRVWSMASLNVTISSTANAHSAECSSAEDELLKKTKSDGSN
jgi:hypothetical protein